MKKALRILSVLWAAALMVLIAAPSAEAETSVEELVQLPDLEGSWPADADASQANFFFQLPQFAKAGEPYEPVNTF